MQNQKSSISSAANNANLSIFITKPYFTSLFGFRAKKKIYIEKKDFIIKTADNAFELEDALKLRHRVFIEELLGKKKLFEIDIDKYDLMSDHLIIIHKESGACIATYRLNSDLYSDKFYSETEFNLDEFKKLPGFKLELGRACVHGYFRGENIMAMLWEGINTYLQMISVKYLFGCSSIMTDNPLTAAMLYKYFKDFGYINDSMKIIPKKKYEIKDFNSYLSIIENRDEEKMYNKAKRLIPGLIMSYFQFGAKIYGLPVIDKKFKCIDVFTCLDMSLMNETYKEKRLNR